MIIPSRETRTRDTRVSAHKHTVERAVAEERRQEKICQQLTTTIQNIIHRSQPDPLKFSNRHQVGSAELVRSWYARVTH